MKNIIILKYKGLYEAWGGLKEICSVHGLPYQSLVRKKFPFKYRDKVSDIKYKFNKVPFRSKAIVVENKEK